MFILGIFSDCIEIALRLQMLLQYVVDHVLQVLQFLGVVKWYFVAHGLSRNPDFAILRYMILFACIPIVAAVCPTCHGSASLFGCTGNPNDCPFLTDIVTNTAAIAGSGTSGLVVSRILPLWVSRLLSKDKLSVVTALAQRSRSGTAAYDLKDKSDYEIRKAVRTGRCPMGTDFTWTVNNLTGPL